MPTPVPTPVPRQLTTLLHRAPTVPDVLGMLVPGLVRTPVGAAPPPLPSPPPGPRVLDRVRPLARDARQTDATTCGSAVLTLLAAVGDERLAAWLRTGRPPDGPRPPELTAAPADRLRALEHVPARVRCGLVQRVVKRRTNARAVLGLPWPEALGTPPWGAARTARFPGAVFGHEPLDDTDRPHLSTVLDHVVAAVRAGVPVPLYAGGDTSRGWATAVPRHVVLVVHADDDRRLTVWEPGRGELVTTDRDALVRGDLPHRALGGWNRLAWVLLPRPGRPA